MGTLMCGAAKQNRVHTFTVWEKAYAVMHTYMHIMMQFGSLPRNDKTKENDLENKETP